MPQINPITWSFIWALLITLLVSILSSLSTLSITNNESNITHNSEIEINW